MIAYLIDPQNQTVTTVGYSGQDFREIYRLIGGEVFGMAYFNYERDHVYYRDDIAPKGPGFSITGYGTPLAGKGLVLGQSGSTDASPSVDLQWLLENLSFCVL